MRILFDFRSYQISAKRGIGRFYLALCEHMLKIGGFEASFLVSKNHDLDIPDSIVNAGRMYLLEEFEQYNDIDEFDFLFKGNFFDPNCRFLDTLYPPEVLSKCKKIVGIMHDLIPLIFSANYLNNSASQKDYAFNNEALQLVNHFFANSVCTKEDCAKFGNIDKKDITVIYGGADIENFHTKNSDKDYVSKERKNYIIFVAGADLRKNFHGAAKAFAIAYESGKLPEDAQIYIVCKSSEWFVEQVSKAIEGYRAQIGKQIIITDYIEDNELIKLLENAKASIFPSFYEGLGLPILESYVAGTPSFASNISATKEFVLPECSFNPYNEKEVVETIINIFNNPKLCEASLQFGRKLLKKINWENAALITIKKLKELQKQDNRIKKVAVFTPLPPEKTGIAIYSYKTHIISQDKYDIISDIHSLNDYASLLNNGTVNNIIPYNSYRFTHLYRNYIGKIFVLGNSQHHSMSLQEAIKTKGEDNRMLYMHEAFIFFAFYPMFNFNLEKIKNFIIKWYPYLKNELPKIHNISEIYGLLREKNVCGIRPLLAMTGIKHIAVNNNFAKELIENEIKNSSDIKIHTLFLPIEDFNMVHPADLKRKHNEYIVGSFGMASNVKHTDLLVMAIDELNKKNYPIKLLLAGYDITKYLKHNNLQSDNIIIKDNPSDEELLSLMKGVDCAVQLRKNPHGESSGCIAQLLGMQQKIITNEGFVSDEFAKYCHFVPQDTTIEEIKTAIKETLSSKQIRNNLPEKYSYANLAQKLYQIATKEC